MQFRREILTADDTDLKRICADRFLNPCHPRPDLVAHSHLGVELQTWVQSLDTGPISSVGNFFTSETPWVCRSQKCSGAWGWRDQLPRLEFRSGSQGYESRLFRRCSRTEVRRASTSRQLSTTKRSFLTTSPAVSTIAGPKKSFLPENKLDEVLTWEYRRAIRSSQVGVKNETWKTKMSRSASGDSLTSTITVEYRTQDIHSAGGF